MIIVITGQPPGIKLKSYKIWNKMRNVIKGHKIEFTVIKSYKIESPNLDEKRTLNIIIIYYKIHLFYLQILNYILQ